MTDPQAGKRKSCQKGLVSLAASAMPPPVHFDSLRQDDEQLMKTTSKAVRRFYKEQNDMIDRFMEVDRVIEALKHGVTPSEYGSLYDSERHDEENPGNSSSESAPLLSPAGKTVGELTSEKRTPLWIIHLAINLSFIANLALFATKVFLALFSGSMAILASAFESFLDIVILMSSIKRLTDPENAGEELDLSTGALVLLGVNIIVKAVLWFWCATIKGSSSVDALAHDHENDVVFSIASTVFPVVGIWAKMPWLDPVGAIILSIYIIYEWMQILLENIRRLTGQAASSEDLKQLTYMAYRFSAKITAVDTVRAYYIGDRLLVEIDIILPPDCPLHEAHDVGEALQDALEMMENVERAFVHLDYNAHHEVEHRRVVDGVGFGG
ncbi:hypothetical protein [Absidia glauca]|uniref:Uncharacterized protein n=1 Tax=Absidia glauca TaxID=4829 RepID=A0A168RKC0_ABSGL|nr:hypothetical protein [Absidia glauca]